MACGCQGNRWTSDSDLVPAEVGPNASGYFFNGLDEDGNEKPDPPQAPAWTPDEGTAE